MRTVIMSFAIACSMLVPLFLVLAFPPWPWWLVAIGVMALSHALVLWPTLRANSQWLGPVITSFDARSKEVWLTIDDGPTDDTPALLDALASRGVRVTFFLKGLLVTQQPDLVRLMLTRGHTVENHSKTHPSGTFWCLPPAAVEAQIDGCSSALKAITGRDPLLFRAPVGMKNPAVHPVLRRRNLILVGWSVRGFDSFGDDVERVVRRIVPRVTSGSIIVMHQGRAFSVACISRVIDELLAQGYAFVIPATERLKTNR